MKKIILIFSLLSLGLTNGLKAAHELGSTRLSSSGMILNSTLFVQDNKYPTIAALPTIAAWGFYDKVFQNKLTLGIDRYNTTALDNFVATVTVQITSYKPLALGASPTIITQTLSVSYEGKNDHQSAATHASNDQNIFSFTDGYAVLTKITGIAVSVNGGANTTVIPANVYLQSETDVERYYPLNPNTTNPNLPDVSKAPFASATNVQINYIAASDEYEVTWNGIPGAEEYDLEWLWLDGNKNQIWYNTKELDFRNNSSRIRTSQQSYRISNVFEQGQVFFRLRGVGRYGSTPTSFDQEIVTPWSWDDITTLTPLSYPSIPYFTSVYNVGSNFLYYITITTNHESLKNWQYKATYAEEGKKKEVISYFDGTLRNRQSVTKNNSDNNAIVGESYYDYNGRAVVQALPIPLNEAKIKFYQYNVLSTTAGTYSLGFNFDNATGKPYGKEFFDQDNATPSTGCAVTASGLHNNYGAAHYYSDPLNLSTQLAQGYVPNAEHFPISQTEFTNDNTGRIAKQGGVGATHQLGSGHETKYFYGAPGQIELDRLFGSEVGFNAHYKKNMVIDANGQVSISYLDQQGRVVATALTGQGPNNVSNLKDASGNPLYALPTATNVINDDLLNKVHSTDFDTNLDNNILGGDELTFSKQILVPTASTYTISYDLQGTSFTYSCLPANACYDCVYDLEINIVDNCQNNPTGFSKITKTLGTIVAYTNTAVNTNTLCGDQIVSFNTSQLNAAGNQLLVDLQVGNYTITKKLKINQAALSYYLEEYLKSSCVRAQSTFTNPNGPDTSGCVLSCDACIQALGTQSAYVNSGKGTNEQWLAEYQVCKEPCEYVSMCDAEYITMLSDVAPGGQYGDWEDNNGNCAPSLYDLSVYNESNQLPVKKEISGSALVPITPNWRNPKHRINNTAGSLYDAHYYDDNGSIAKVYVTRHITGTGASAVTSYSPPVNVALTTPLSGTTNQFTVEPQYLTNVSDFISNYKQSWATSLVYYHPEYPYYDWCIKNSTLKITNPYPVSILSGTVPVTNTISTSDDYDSLLLVTDNVVGLTSADLTKLCNPLTYDPYWTTNGMYYNNSPMAFSPTTNIGTAVNQLNFTSGSLASPWNNIYRNAQDRYSDYQRAGGFSGPPISMPVFAAMITTSCAIQYGQSIPNIVSCLNTGYGITSLMTTPDQIVTQLPLALKNKYWDNFKMLYLAMKQEMQQEAAESYVMNGNMRGCNDCIGDPNFDAFTPLGVPFTPYTMFTPIGYGASSYFTAIHNQWFFPYSTPNDAHYCSVFTGALYSSKIKRFPNAKNATDLQNTMSAGDPGASIYANTGLCPNAFYFQGLLNSLGANNQLTSATLNLSTMPEFNQDLYKVVAGGVIPTTYTPANWVAGNTANVLTANISIGANPACPLNLTFPTGYPFDFSNTGTSSTSTYAFLKLYHLTPGTNTGGTYNFTILADVTLTSGSSSTFTTVTLSGNTCIPLTGCSFTPPCAPTTAAIALQKLMNAIASTGNLCSASATTPIYLSDPTIQPVFVNSFGAVLGAGNWVWEADPLVTSPYIGFVIKDFAGVNTKTLKIQFNAASFSGCTGYAFNFANITGNNTGANYFNIAINVPTPTGTSPTSVVTTTTTGSVLLNGTSLSMGICGFDAAKCTTQEHQNRQDMETFLKEYTTPGLLTTATATNITTYGKFGLNLRKDLVGNYQTYSGTAPNIITNTNNFYWVKNTALSTNTLLTGSFFASTLTLPTPVPPSACTFSLKFADPATAIANGDIFGSTGNFMLSNFVLAASPMVNMSVYDFSVTATFGLHSYTLLGTSGCFGMRDCSDCQGASVGGGTSFCSNKIINNFPCVSTPTFSVFETATNTPYTQLPTCSSNPVLSGATSMVVGNSVTFSSGAIWNTTSIGGNALFIQNANGNEFQFQQTFTRPPCACPTTLFFWLHNNTAKGGVPFSTSEFTVSLKDQYGNIQTVPLSGTPYTLGDWTQYSSGSLNIISGQPYTFILKTILPASAAAASFAIAGIALSPVDFCTTPPSLPCVQVQDAIQPFPEIEYEDPCVQYAKDIVENTAQELYNAYINSVKTAFVQGYIKKCMGNAVENMYMKYNAGDYHYTLYYYDQAGNLVRTVPPEGVHVETNTINLANIAIDRSSNTPYATKLYYTTHNLQTTYTYNSLNQLVQQQTPDAGISYFWYDKLGRLVASQNAKQRAKANHSNNYYSYTKYDYLGRIAEVGEMIITYDFVTMTPATIAPLLNPITNDYPTNLTPTKTEITRTYYGDDANYSALLPGSNFTAGSQEYLRSRVASVTIEDVDDGINTTYNHGTHYSYDVHGNVKELIQENQTLPFAYHKYKKVNYTYDLISGKVNKVAYQPGQIDMFLHRYEYDADNRITKVFTSKDNVIWTQDAKYFYYLHGPMARVEIGHDKVQAIDYAYTIQGWIKGVNSNILNPNNDIGRDGIGTLTSPSSGGTAAQVVNKFIAQDAFGYSLTYFNNATNKDYLANNATTGTANDFVAIVPAGMVQSPDLYNGNIRQMVTSYLDANAPAKTYNPTSLLKNYTYDQLNRIETAFTNDNLNLTTNTWNTAPTLADIYKETFRYDQNGNILNANRNGNLTTTLAMDNLTYNYIAGTNKLDYVADAIAGTPYGNDFASGQTTGNYQYDAIGNLISDAAEGITNIEWTVYGKIKRITRPAGSTKPNLLFCYDASGNRISKTTYTGTTPTNRSGTTYYIRDAQGNVMTTYLQEPNNIDIPQLKLSEQHIYGSSRLGLINNSDNLTAYVGGLNTTLVTKTLGYKSYEFGNHLSNVILVVSDRKIGAWVSGSTLDHFSSEIITANDYFCFGFEIKGRAVNVGTIYPYGMNGQEHEDEVAQGIYTAEFWEYDSRTGRRWNLDVVNQVSISDYACFRNNPIVNKDPNGAEAKDTRLFDRETGKQVGYHEDAMGKDYVVDDYGKQNKDGSFTHGTTVTPEDRQAVNNNANKVDKALSYSHNTSRSMDQFSKGMCIGAVAMAAAPLLPYALPALGEGGLTAYLGGATLRASLDGAAQMAANNGDVTKLDVGDALMSGFLTPVGSAVLGGAVDIRPFAAKDEPVLKVVGVNKGVGESAFDGGAKYIFGRSGPIGSQYGKLGNAFGSIAGNTMSPLITAPFNLGAKIATKEAKKAIFGK